MNVHGSVRAAVSLAASHGVMCTDPLVLKAASNVLVHLRPAPVVARVAGRTALMRPAVASHFARDLAVSTFLAGRGVPVVTASDELPAGPHTHDGFVVSFSTYVPHDPDVRLPHHDVLKMLPALHAELRHYDGPLPVRGPLDDLENTLAYLRGRAPLEELQAQFADLRSRWDPLDVHPLHGDAHHGNVMVTPSGPVWNDFEDTWRGPIAWDLACAVGSNDEGAAQRAVEIYGGGTAPSDVEFHVELRSFFTTLWGVFKEHS
ncbi:aminoglycoside phosphotransferase family protein [Lentzea sp. NBRC 102530]|uniref:aminoglycoside phosphotransferase family protein n=1 Tax=Lentzea sp. NBRC 102530 TaxID=3032201 RepID=UPI0025547FFE|nr:aminoglycoside phosphotransferase family protein [Lentzea sp. NBRC 102530]